MANFAAVLDPDPGRRSSFQARARAAAPVQDGLEIGEVVSGSLAVVWAAAPSAPVSVHSDAEGAAVVWGDAVVRSKSEALGAREVQQAWGVEGAGSSAADGFHAWLTASASGSLAVGGDLVGLFPIYYWSGPGGVSVVASSPDLFTCHVEFRPVPSKAGLAGVLLTGGPVDGFTLWEGVRRLAPGRVLLVELDGEAREVRQYRLPVAESDPLAEDHAVPALDEALAQAVGRMLRSDRTHTLMLSGGRDSRLLAGYMRRLDLAFAAQALGHPSDHDAQCARQVARALGIAYAVADVPQGRYPRYADRHVRAEHLMGHLAGLDNWGVGELLAPHVERVVTGHAVEFAGGGFHLDWAGMKECGEPSWVGFRRTIATHALGLDVLDRLVRDAELRDAIHEGEAALERRFSAYGETPAERARGFLWGHWARHHGGAFAWRVCFRAWPVLPILDQDLLELATRVPTSLAAGRGLHDALLKARHPALARIPLVRASGSLDPVSPGLGWAARRLASRVGSEVAARIPAGPRAGPERRYYRRTYDLDNVGWSGVRRAAEPFRDGLHDLFDPEALLEFLPTPDRALRLERPINEGYGRKTLLALMLRTERFPI